MLTVNDASHFTIGIEYRAAKLTQDIGTALIIRTFVLCKVMKHYCFASHANSAVIAPLGKLSVNGNSARLIGPRYASFTVPNSSRAQGIFYRFRTNTIL